jgi:hypothetical protein
VGGGGVRGWVGTSVCAKGSSPKECVTRGIVRELEGDRALARDLGSGREGIVGRTQDACRDVRRARQAGECGGKRVRHSEDITWQGMKMLMPDWTAQKLSRTNHRRLRLLREHDSVVLGGGFCRPVRVAFIPLQVHQSVLRLQGMRQQVQGTQSRVGLGARMPPPCKT